MKTKDGRSHAKVGENDGLDLTREIENAVESHAMSSEREKAYEELRRSEQRLDLGLRVAGVALAEVDYTTGLNHLSAESAQQFGLGTSAVAVTRERVHATFHPDDQAELATRIAESLDPAGAGWFAMDHRVVWPTGEVRWLRVRKQVTFAGEGCDRRPLRAMLATFDVTTEKRVEERLRLFEKAVTGMRDVVMITEAEPVSEPGPRIVYVNPAFTEMTGYTAEEAIGRSPRFLQGPKSSRAALDKIRAALKTWQPVTVEVTNCRKDGTEFEVEFSIIPVANEHGWFTHWVSLQRDVSERNRAAEALAGNAALFAKIIEQAPGGVYVMDAQLRVREVNTEALPVFASVQPVIGREIGEVMEALWGPELGQECTAIFRHTLETGERYVSPRFDHHRQDIDEQQAYEWETQRLTLPDGQHGVVCYFQDVTARERATTALRTSEAHMRLATEATEVGIWEWNVLTNQIRWDAQMFRLYGIAPTPDGLVSYQTWAGAVLPEDLAATEAIMQETLRQLGRSIRNFRIGRANDGECRHIETVETVRTNAQGQAEWVLGTNLDVTERKRAEAALRTEVTERKQAEAQVHLLNRDLEQRVAERKMTEELQRAASAYARSLIEASLDPLVTISAQGKITDVNEASVQATGVPREQLIGTDFSDYFTEPDNARVGYQQVFSEGLVRDYPLAIRHTSGRIVDVLYNAAVYRDDKGNVLGVFAAARDVTVQKQASRYARSLIEASLDPLVTISAQGKITDVNEASVQATGVPREQLIGTDFSDYFTAPDNARDGYRQVFSEGLVRDYPLAIRHTTGRIMDVLYNAAVYRDDKGNVLGVFAAARDVTVQKQASQYARSLIEASLDPLVTISAQGKITDVNEASAQATGVPREQLIGTDFSDYFTAPDNARAGYRQVFSEGLVRDYPLAIRHTSGRIMDVLYNAAVYRDDKGNVLGVFAAARDVTERKRFEQSLEQTNEELRTKSNENVEIERKNAELEQARHALEEKAAELARASGYKSEFLANMSHELRTPLNSILIFSQQLAENKAGNLTAKQVEFSGHIHSSGNDLLHLIDEILDLSKIESGSASVEVARILFAELHGDIDRDFRHMAERKNLPFTVTFAPSLPQAMVSDLRRLQQILKNLIFNAIKFTDQGQVEVRVDPVTQGWTANHPVLSVAPQVIAFVVTDTGIGIALEKQQLIFEAFQQADAITSRQYGGTGLGLAISRELADLLGGEIKLTSVLGQGSSFTLFLPLHYSGPDAVRPTSAMLPPVPHSIVAMPKATRYVQVRDDALRGRKVLVVDDDARNIYALTALLENYEMEVLSTTRSRSAIDLIQKTPDLSLVLMDIMMPEMDSYETMQMIRQESQFRTLPILALTAKAMKGDREKCLAAGASDYLAKPVNTDQLLTMMRLWISRGTIYDL